MTNHVHWVLVAEQEDSLAVLFRRVHGRYAQYLNARRLRSGHLWQNRFFSCPLAAEREPVAIRYVECNPLRAGIVQHPAEYEWSSAAAHLSGPSLDRKSLLDWEYWNRCGGAEYWRTLLSTPEHSRDSGRIWCIWIAPRMSRARISIDWICPAAFYTRIWWYAKFPNHYAGNGADTNKQLGEYDMKTWGDDVANALRAIKSDQVSLRLQNEFYDKAEHPLQTPQ